MKTIICRGFIKRKSHYEDYDALFVGDENEIPFVEFIEDKVDNSLISMKYWTSEKELSKEDLIKNYVEYLYGKADCIYAARYSDITGYLWTDEDFNIGGHNILEKLDQNIGKFIHLEIVIHERN